MIVKKSKIHGKGVFADKYYSHYAEILKFAGNPPDVIYFNHSCNPNSFIVQPDEGDMQTHTLYSKGIKKGQEITIDYRIGKLYKDLWEKTISDKCNCPIHKKARVIERFTDRLHRILSPFISEEFLLKYKPVHLCWWFEKYELPIPKYFIGLTTTSTSTSSTSSSSSSSTSSTSSSTSSTSSSLSTSSTSTSSTSTSSTSSSTSSTSSSSSTSHTTSSSSSSTSSTSSSSSTSSTSSSTSSTSSSTSTSYTTSSMSTSSTSSSSSTSSTSSSTSSTSTSSTSSSSTSTIWEEPEGLDLADNMIIIIDRRDEE